MVRIDFNRLRFLVIDDNAAGVTEFLAKPISAKGLYQRIVNVVANPHPFVRTKTYFGPDRRRTANPNYVGPERRKAQQDRRYSPSPLDRQNPDSRLTRDNNTMVPPKKRPAAVQTFSDHEVIVPDHDLHKAVCKTPLAPGDVDDPVARGKCVGQTVDRVCLLDEDRMRAT